MDEQKEKQNAKKKRSALPIYAIGIVWLLYAGKLNTFRGILSCAVVSAIDLSEYNMVDEKNMKFENGLYTFIFKNPAGTKLIN